MKLIIATLIAFVAGSTIASAGDYEADPDWLKPAEGMETIGSAHGDVAVSEAGDVYVSVGGPRGGIQVFSPQGDYLRNVADAPVDFHGFVIRKLEDGEFIYGARLFGQSILKMQLDGKIVQQIDSGMIPDDFKRPNKEGKPTVLLTCVDVAPDGRIVAVDGYSSDYIHIFSPEGRYETSFGGKAAPYNFKTLHKLCIDTRFDPPQILCCDREGRRMVSLSLDGEILGTVPDMKRPAAVAIYGDLAAVAEIEGRMSLLDKQGNRVAVLGANDVEEQTATNKIPPADWRPGILMAPHGVDFDAEGNMFVTEYNLFGRVVRYDRTAKTANR